MADENTGTESGGNSPLSNLKITTKGDIAAAGLGLTFGFLLDSWHMIFGIPPGTFAVYGAAAGVGLKNTVHAWLESSRKNKREKQKAEIEKEKAKVEEMNLAAARHEISKRCVDLIEYLETLETSDAYREREKCKHIESLKGELAIFQRDWITIDQLKASFDENLKKVREDVLTVTVNK
jgi:hypothetical protein